MPRLPTILVIGSQAISTTPVSSAVVMPLPPVRRGRKVPPGRWSPGLHVAGKELIALLAPLGLLVGRLRGAAAEGAADGAVHGARGRGALGRRGLVHERHELVGEAWHGAGDADAAHVGAATDAVDPAAFGHVALDHRPPAAELDQALGRTVFTGEVALLVVAGPVAPLVDGGPEQPRRAQCLGRGGQGGRGGPLGEAGGNCFPTVCRGGGDGGPVKNRGAPLLPASPSQGSPGRPSPRSGYLPWRVSRHR